MITAILDEEVLIERILDYVKYESLYSSILTILTAIITGGFILVFVEIGNRKNREIDKHYYTMDPFIHKLSAFFRFIYWCETHIEYPKDVNENEEKFRELIERMALCGRQIIMSGGDYGVDFFYANDLQDIASDANNVWAYYDKMNHPRLEWNSINEDKDITKELRIFNPEYLNNEQDVDLVAKVAEDFYIDNIQIKNEAYYYETKLRMYSIHTAIVMMSVVIILIELGLMIFSCLSAFWLRLFGIIVIVLLFLNLLLLSMDIKMQIKLKNSIWLFVKKHWRRKIKRKDHNCSYWEKKYK